MSTKMNLKELAKATGGTAVLAATMSSRAKANRNIKLVNILKLKMDKAKDGNEMDALVAEYEEKIRKLNEIKLTPKTQKILRWYLNLLTSGD